MERSAPVGWFWTKKIRGLDGGLRGGRCRPGHVTPQTLVIWRTLKESP